jgi:hypothetical protein
MYAPDLSEYLNSSLFDYAGPGGLDEYTYGQGLRTDGAGYDIWGTPTDVPNPYYWGQFGEGFVEPEEPGIADGVISLPPIDMPAGVPPTNNNPNVGTPDTNFPTGGGGNGDKDLNYFETLAAMGIDPSDAPSTTFPGPNDKLIEEAIMNQDAVKETLPYQSGLDPNLLNSYINESEVGDALPISSVPKGDFNNLSPIGPSIYNTQHQITYY